MKAMIRIDVDGHYFSGGAYIQVTEPIVQAFEPINITDDPLIAMATGDTVAYSQTHETRLEFRKDAAKILAQELAHHLIKEMAKDDRINGYEVTG